MIPSDKITVCYAHETFNLTGEMAKAVNLRIANERQSQHEETWAMAMAAFKHKCRDQQERRPETCKWEQMAYVCLERFASDLQCPPLTNTDKEAQ